MVKALITTRKIDWFHLRSKLIHDDELNITKLNAIILKSDI